MPHARPNLNASLSRDSNPLHRRFVSPMDPHLAKDDIIVARIFLVHRPYILLKFC